MDDDASTSYAGAGEGEGSQPDPIDEGAEKRQGPYVEEDDEGEELAGDELDGDDDGQGGDPDPEGEDDDAPPPKAKEKVDVAALEQRLQEKEQQAHSLTIALQQEREKVRRAEKRFYQVVEKAMEQGQAAARAATPEGEAGEPAEPDPEDAVGQLHKKLDGVHERLDKQDEERAAKAAEEQTDRALAWVQEDARKVAEQEPGYEEAAEVAATGTRNAIRAQLQLSYPGTAPEEIEEHVEVLFAQYTARLQVMCMQSGKSYAQAVLTAARSLGWQGGGAAPAKLAKAKPSVLDRERAARAGGPSLSGVPSSPPRRQPNSKDVLEMDDDDFDELMESGTIDFKALATQLASGARG